MSWDNKPKVKVDNKKYKCLIGNCGLTLPKRLEKEHNKEVHHDLGQKGLSL